MTALNFSFQWSTFSMTSAFLVDNWGALFHYVWKGLSVQMVHLLRGTLLGAYLMRASSNVSLRVVYNLWASGPCDLFSGTLYSFFQVTCIWRIINTVFSEEKSKPEFIWPLGTYILSFFYILFIVITEGKARDV